MIIRHLLERVTADKNILIINNYLKIYFHKVNNL